MFTEDLECLITDVIKQTVGLNIMYILKGELKYLVKICFQFYTLIIYITQTLYPQQSSKHERLDNEKTGLKTVCSIKTNVGEKKKVLCLTECYDELFDNRSV